jgi:hypothetical protein
VISGLAFWFWFWFWLWFWFGPEAEIELELELEAKALNGPYGFGNFERMREASEGEIRDKVSSSEMDARV